MAIQVYGPFFVPINSIQQTNVNSQCGGIMVFNRSLYNDMFVSLSTDQPTTVPAVGMGSVGSTNYAGSDITHWHIYIPPGHVASLPIPNAKSYGILNPYSIGPNSNGTGTIYYAAVPYYQNNVAPPPGVSADAQAPTGYSGFGYSQITFLTWGINDLPPSIAATSLTAELTGQPRIVALPTSPAYGCSGAVHPGAANTWITVGNSVSIGNYPFQFSTHGGGLNGFLTVGLYSLTISTIFNAVTIQGQRNMFRIVVVDNASTVVSSLAYATGWASDMHVAECYHQSTATSTSNFCYSPSPLTIALQIAAGAGPPYSLVNQINIQNNAGGPWDFTVSSTFDVSGFYPQTPGSFIGAGTGFGFPLAYQEYTGFSY